MTAIDEDNLIYADCDAGRGEYLDIEFDRQYLITSANGAIDGIYRFKRDQSGDKCGKCALSKNQNVCKTCFECYDASAVLVKKGVNMNDEVFKNYKPDESNAEPGDSFQGGDWENDLRQLEMEIEKLEREIDKKTDEVKEMKKSLKDMFGRMRRLVATGSKEYLESHPLFKEIADA